jgi:PKHD-type hydroxylase
MLLTLHDVLSPSEVCQAQAWLKDAPWEPGSGTAGAQAARVKHNEQLPQMCVPAVQIRDIVLKALNANPTFFSATLPKKIYTPRINRYAGDSNYFGNHIDGAIRMLSHEKRVRTDISCTVFLSDPNTYDGGELTIADTFGEQSVKLSAGSIVIYPGTSLHQVKPVTRGERLACFFWIESLVRSDEQRRLLYELDMSLLSLRSQYGETPEAVTQTGIYHNLLRMWADT